MITTQQQYDRFITTFNEWFVAQSPYCPKEDFKSFFDTYFFPELDFDRTDPMKIVKLVSTYMDIAESDILGKQRYRDFVDARQLCFYLIKEHCRTFENKGFSLHCIAKVLNKDHATVIHSVRTMQNKIDTEPRMRRIYEEVTKQINILKIK